LCISRTADACRCEAGGPPDGSELNRNGLEWVAEGELSAAVVRPLPRSTGPLKHATLLAAIFTRADLLPVRFAVVLPHEEAVRDLLRRKYADLLRALDQLKGAGEMALRIQLPHIPLPAAPPLPNDSDQPGKASLGYLAGRRARYQRQDDLQSRAQLTAESCIRTVSGLYRDWRRLSPEPSGTVRLAFLVERRLSADFAERLEAWRAQRRDEQYSLVGPWPPYSFV